MKIGITITENAYTPEAYAYEKYLSSLGHSIQLNYVLEPDNDINIYFMGLRPIWKKNIGSAKEIHEYQSLSTPPYSYFKNKVKKVLNKKPDGRIFLNDSVHSYLNFNDISPFIYRDMGVDDLLFQEPSRHPKYDVLYCGSISGRIGLIEALLNISKILTVLVVGKVSETDKKRLNSKNITLIGAVNREFLPEIYRNARFGLNFTPDIYPYNIQTSTKTLEYLASGLGVISNRYKWVEDFFNEINYKPIWLNVENSLNAIELENINSSKLPYIQKYSWHNILSHCDLDGFLSDIVNEKD